MIKSYIDMAFSPLSDQSLRKQSAELSGTVISFISVLQSMYIYICMYIYIQKHRHKHKYNGS
jgi:hypothetical protein